MYKTILSFALLSVTTLYSGPAFAQKSPIETQVKPETSIISVKTIFFKDPKSEDSRASYQALDDQNRILYRQFDAHSSDGEQIDFVSFRSADGAILIRKIGDLLAVDSGSTLYVNIDPRLKEIFELGQKFFDARKSADDAPVAKLLPEIEAVFKKEYPTFWYLPKE